MGIDRRALLTAIGAGVAASAPAALAQDTSQSAETTSLRDALEESIAARARENRYRLDFDGDRFSGQAWEMLLEEGRSSQFFCIGEEHGIAENPKLAAQIFSALTPSGYERVYVEISPPMAAELDGAARQGVAGLERLFSDPGSRVAFFGMREEAEWLAQVRAASRGRQAIHGLDYEVGADRRLIARLKAKRKPASAAAALDALESASGEAWAQYETTRNPQFVFSFSGDPALVRAVRDAWPAADADARWILDTLEETLEINRLWVAGRGWESNQRRALFNRANLRRSWPSRETPPRSMFKFGSSHIVRGLSHTQVFDTGTMVSEAAESRGSKSFHLMVLPGAGSMVAQFDPAAWVYRPSDPGTYVDEGRTPLMQVAHPDAFTLIDLRPIRPLVFGRRHKALDADLVRTIHGFDALLVMSGSTPSANL